MSHNGYDGDLAIAPQLTDVGVIIGGDSHTFLGENSPIVNKTPSGKYPTVVTNKSGGKVCIGQAWEYTKVFARMKINFNPDSWYEWDPNKSYKLVINDYLRDGSENYILINPLYLLMELN